nr:MAG TPA: protein of unknown function (DUF2225) [Caudoviricetes sp.]
MRYAISSSVKAPMQVDSPLCTQGVKWEKFMQKEMYCIICGRKNIRV